MSSARRGDKRPSRDRYHKEMHLVMNKMRRIRNSFGRNKQAGNVAAEAWKRQFGLSKS